MKRMIDHLRRLTRVHDAAGIGDGKLLERFRNREDDLAFESLVRRLTPQEDKLSLARLKAEELAGLAAYLGALLGVAHRRGGSSAFAAWTARDCAGILERAPFDP